MCVCPVRADQASTHRGKGEERPLGAEDKAGAFPPAWAFTVTDTGPRCWLTRPGRHAAGARLLPGLAVPEGVAGPAFGPRLTGAAVLRSYGPESWGRYLRRGSSASATCSRASVVRALQRKMWSTAVNRSNTCTPQAASSSFWKERGTEGICKGILGGWEREGVGDPVASCVPPQPAADLTVGTEGGKRQSPIPWWAGPPSPRSGRPP